MPSASALLSGRGVREEPPRPLALPRSPRGGGRTIDTLEDPSTHAALSGLAALLAKAALRADDEEPLSTPVGAESSLELSSKGGLPNVRLVAERSPEEESTHGRTDTRKGNLMKENSDKTIEPRPDADEREEP